MLRRKYREIYYFFQYQLKKILDNGKTITYNLKFIDSFRFMWTSLSSIVDNLSEIYYKNVEIKIANLCEILSGLKITDCTANVKNVKKLKPINRLI